MQRWLSTIFIIILLSGCSSSIDKASDAYSAGYYQESVATLTDYLDQKGKFPGAKDTHRILTIMSNVVAHYKILAEDRFATYPKRIEGYEGLLFVRKQVGTKFYATYIPALVNRYDTAYLNRTLGELYYQWGNSINGTSKENYLERAEIFKKGLNYDDWKDIGSLYLKNHKQYSQMQASEYYQAGQQAVKAAQYEQAAKHFLMAAETYHQYGNYKDSQQLSVKYDKLYRKNESDRLYKQAQATAKNARTRADYRAVAAIFNESAAIYAPYGQVNDAKAQYQRYYDMGIIRFYIKSDNYFGPSLRSMLNTSEIALTSSPVSADVVLTLDIKESYYKDLKRESWSDLSDYIQTGQEAYINNLGQTLSRDTYRLAVFKKREIQDSNIVELKANLRTSGGVNYHKNYTIHAKSKRIEIDYFGDVPNNRKYQSEKTGQLKSERDLTEEARDDLESQLKSDILALMPQLKYL